MTQEFQTNWVERFNRDGFVVMANMLDAATMGDVARWCDELLAWPEVAGRHMVYYEDDQRHRGQRIVSRIENFYPYHDGFRALVDSPQIHSVLTALFGERATLFKEKINFKIPGSAGFEAHQDVQAGWDAYAPLHITVLVSVDAATPANGCLEMAPGWHRQGLLGEMWAPLSEQVPDDAYQMCPSAVGDVVLFDSFAPHRSKPNASDSARRVLYLTYNAASAGDHRARYYADKRANYPPDCERSPDREYVYRV